jgi:uncharacterized membrane protein
MANIAIAIFLILFGVTMLVSTEIPKWVVGLAACIAGLVVLAGGGWWKRGP